MITKRFNRHFIFVLLAAVLWGTAGIFVRSVETTELTEMQIVLGRTLFASVILGIIILVKDRSLFKIKFRDIWLFVADGLFSIVLFNFSYYTTMSLTSLSVAAVLLYTAPFFVVIISRFLFGERLTKQKLIACLTAFMGCCFVSGVFDSSHSVGGKAVFFGLLTGLGYALYTVFGEILLKRGYKTLTITFYVFLSAAICSIPFTDFSHITSSYTVGAASIVFLMAVFNTVIPYILYTTGLSGVDATSAPIIATVEPVVATIVGALIYKEALTLTGFIGIVLVLASVVILNLKAGTANAGFESKG